MISLCYKAGYVKHGEFQVDEAVGRKKAVLLIVANDASNNTKKRIANIAKTANIRSFEFENKETLGKIIGKDERSCLAICNLGFADKIWLLYKEA